MKKNKLSYNKKMQVLKMRQLVLTFTLVNTFNVKILSIQRSGERVLTE